MHHRSYFFHSDAAPEIEPCAYCGQPALSARGVHNPKNLTEDRGEMIYSCARCMLISSLFSSYRAMEGTIVRLSQVPRDQQERAFLRDMLDMAASSIRRNKGARIIPAATPGLPDQIAYDEDHPESLRPPSFLSAKAEAQTDDEVERDACFDCGGSPQTMIALASLRNDPAMDGDVLVCSQCLKGWITSTQEFIDGARVRLDSAPANYSERQKFEDTLRNAEDRLAILMRYSQ